MGVADAVETFSSSAACPTSRVQEVDPALRTLMLSRGCTFAYEIRNEAWRKQFTGKNSSAKLKLDEDIRNISGATLSCRHITDGVKRLLAFYDVALRRG